MKCDTCKKKTCELPSDPFPMGAVYCSAGHWDSYDMNEDEEEDLWKDCKEYDQR
jgi:hypothetical protein